MGVLQKLAEIREIKYITVDKIKPDPNQPRKGMYSQEELENMASRFNFK